MRSLGIAKIEVDVNARLLVFPEKPDPLFQFVYRYAAEVYWDDAGYFYSPTPREWSYLQWFERIRFAVRHEAGVELVAMQGTTYKAVPPGDEREIRLALVQSI